MARVIDADEFLKNASERENQIRVEYGSSFEDGYGMCLDDIKKAPTIDPVKHGYVPIEVVRQIQWERDIAMSYLEEAGIGFGEKAELQRVRHAKWIQPDKEHEFEDLYRCSNCYYLADWRDLGNNHCPDCGARMDGE